MTESKPAPRSSSEFVGSLARGLSVIQAFGHDAPKMTLSEVAERTGLNRAAARRFLLTLCELGFARTDGKLFELTPKVLTLGYAYLSSLDIWQAAGPYLQEVTDALNESCSASVLDGTSVVYVARSAAPHRIMSVSLQLGSRLPAHATGMGQVLLAGLDDACLDAYLAEATLEPFTRRTLTDAAKLRERLAVVREHGYALVDQELEEGLRSIAVPVRDGSGRVLAALNASSHAARVTKPTMLRTFLPVLQEVSGKITAHLVP